MRIVIAFLCVITYFSLFSQQVDMDQFPGMKPRNIGPAGMSGRVTSIDVVLSDKSQIYIGAAAGGVWKSENAGHTWTPIFENELAASIGDIEIYQKNPSIIYVATGEGNPRNSQNSGWGMYKSIDGGKTWNHLGLENTRQIHRILVNPNNPDHVVVGVSGASWGESEHRGVYKSQDGGESWTKVLYINESTGVADLIMDPSNPNRMYCAMWEHRRWPWFFKSGGKGSGLYVSDDGGSTWKQLGKENGLPDGEIGRIGLTVSPTSPQIVYAYIESKDNAIYRSTDKGKNWTRQSKSGDRLIGDRPFYYADIYADTKNENRLYSIASTVTVSEDGGKTWSTFAPGNKIHTDHHAWWSDPDNPNFIMIGHDGGLNISHDRGKNWWFAENLPLAQFYHIRVDNAFPYNVMGGLQDNGSWRGPSRTWFKGGIRNFYWQRLSVGDGFDVVPDPLDNDYGYAMGQAGNLVRWHAPSGHLKKIKPVHPDGEYLRFNWNAGIAISPIDQKTIYYGSQYVHKSTDYGDSWQIISPDLTTNDVEKQQFLETGGLTYDVTGAEFHTTIITIDPSPLDENVIWVGTDDGNVQVTQDGGNSWSNVIENIPDVPSTTWVTQITASAFDPAHAVVVFDDHRRDNWSAYVFQTKDYGKTWTRLLDDEDVRGYAYCFVQDPIEPNLMFVGAEFGLYVSFDAGNTWNQWTNGLPTMPITDLIIQRREHDLVIGTFGRAIWILDDIRPLRQMASSGVEQITEEAVFAFDPPTAHLMIIGESIGYRHGKIGDALYNGENRPYGALLSFHIHSTDEIDLDKLENQVKIEIKDDQGRIRRTLYHKPNQGVNRIAYDLTSDAIRRPGTPKKSGTSQARSGFAVSPGTYEVVISYRGESASTSLTIEKDPRLQVSDDAISRKANMFDQLEELIRTSTALTDAISTAKKSIDLSKEMAELQDVPKTDTLFAMIKTAKDSLNGLNELILGKTVQGIYRKPEVLSNRLFRMAYKLDHPLVPVTANQEVQWDQLQRVVQSIKDQVNLYLDTDLVKIKERVQELNLSAFKED